MAQCAHGGVLAIVGGLLLVAGIACTEPQSGAKHPEPDGERQRVFSKHGAGLSPSNTWPITGLHYPESSPQAAMTVGLAMIEVCAAGPPSLSVDTGALRVAEWLRDYEQVDFLD